MGLSLKPLRLSYKEEVLNKLKTDLPSLAGVTSERYVKNEPGKFRGKEKSFLLMTFSEQLVRPENYRTTSASDISLIFCSIPKAIAKILLNTTIGSRIMIRIRQSMKVVRNTEMAKTVNLRNGVWSTDHAVKMIPGVLFCLIPGSLVPSPSKKSEFLLDCFLPAGLSYSDRDYFIWTGISKFRIKDRIKKRFRIKPLNFVNSHQCVG